MIDYAALKTELDTDPTGRGYAAASDIAAAELLNEVQGGITVNVTSVLMAEVLEAIVPADWVALTDGERAGLLLYASQDTLNPNAANVVDAFTTFFAATPTLTALNALQTRNGSRAEELWGENVVIHHIDVAIARSL